MNNQMLVIGSGIVILVCFFIALWTLYDPGKSEEEEEETAE